MMMRRAAVLFAGLVVAPISFADDGVMKGLQNLTTIHRLALLGEMTQMGGVAPQNLPPDPWGTPYRFEVTAEGYRITGAGSDKHFDETTWETREQFRDLTGDVVFENAKVLRTNRTWLAEQVTDATQRDLDELRSAEMLFMMSRTPTMQSMLARRITESNVESIAAHIAAGGDAPGLMRDAWGTPLRIENEGGKVRIISAGADRQFNEATWGTPPATPSFDEDIVYDNGALTRRVDEKDLLRAAGVLTAEPLVQPPDKRTTSTAQRSGGDIQAPVVVNRVEPVYPESYRRARISGIVILETVISETGDVTEAHVLKSLGPELDMAALTAVRQWKFQPATLEGKPVPVIFNLTINFKLK